MFFMTLRPLLSTGLILSLFGMALGARVAWQEAPKDVLVVGFEAEDDLKAASSEAKAEMAITVEQRTQGEKALKLALPPGPYPGVSLAVLADWRPHKALKFDLWSQRNAFLGIRIDDKSSRDYATRYNDDSGVVREGWNRVQVPLDKVAKSVKLNEVRALVIFLQKVAEPTVVYLDNVRLGALEEDLDDRPLPSELGAKKEFNWSTEVVTPHIPWAKPLAGGRIKALLVPGIHAGREAIELIQRLDLDAEIVTVEKTWDINRWGMGDHYGARGDRGDFRLQYRYLQQAVASDKPYDVIVLPLVHGWNALTPKTRQALKQRVTDGAGLVLIHPYVGKDGSDASIWEISPLTGCPDDYMPEDGYVRIPSGALASGHPAWRAAGEHFITKGVALDLLPFENMELYKYKARGTVILESDGGPVAAVSEFGKDCLAKFRAWLQTVYPSLDALNAKWQTTFAAWDEVVPLTTEEAKAHKSFAPWADHRTFMEITYADAYRFIRDCLREVDPEGELRISGTQATTAYNGCDWSRITEFVRDTGPYTTGDQWDLHRSFLREGRSGGWTGYGSSGDGVRHFIWNGLFHRLGYMNIFWQYSCLNPDLTLSQSARDMAVAFTELRDGIGMLLNHARREPAPVAIHYSLASCHAATITGKQAEWDAARRNAILLLNDLGWQFNFVSSQQVEAGQLQQRGYQAIVLPFSLALSDKEAGPSSSSSRPAARSSA